MSVLTRLAAADPARGIATVARPDLDELIARAERETPIETVSFRRPSRLRALAPIAAVVAAVLVAAGVVVFRHSDNTAAPVHAGYGAVASDFPVNAKPRPIVLIGESVIVGGFQSGDAKTAFANGSIDLATRLPATPATVAGYGALSAAEAVRQLTGNRDRCCGTTTTRLRITAVTLARHRFRTDHGDQLLPAWQISFAGDPYDTYVLAIATSARYPQRLGGGPESAGEAKLSNDGRRLTVWVVAHHRSTGPCDVEYRQTLSSAQGSEGVRIVVTTDVATTQAPPAGPSSPIMGCDLIGHLPDPAGVPVEGAPDTETITLDKPLGNRIVVDAKDRPYVVTR